MNHAFWLRYFVLYVKTWVDEPDVFLPWCSINDVLYRVATGDEIEPVMVGIALNDMHQEPISRVILRGWLFQAPIEDVEAIVVEYDEFLDGPVGREPEDDRFLDFCRDVLDLRDRGLDERGIERE
jgi:hypothetical protein